MVVGGCHKASVEVAEHEAKLSKMASYQALARRASPSREVTEGAGHLSKLRISHPGEWEELEADQAAEAVWRGSSPRVTGGDEDGPPRIQRSCAACASSEGICPACNAGDGRIEAFGTTRSSIAYPGKRTTSSPRADNDLQTVPLIVHETLRTPGRQLDSSDRSRMESRFGYDFSQVRIHADEEAAEAARSIQASAYTVGQHIVFGKGRYQPKTAVGERLLSHELAHVVQQGIGIHRRIEGTEELHQDIAEEYRRVIGPPEGGIGRFGERMGPSTAEIVYSGLYEVPDLPIPVIERLRSAVASTNVTLRQNALDLLTDWARTRMSLGIDWGRVRFVRYAPASRGSRTEASDPMNIEVWIGRQAFSSTSNLYSTFRHELVHVVQHHDHQRAVSRGWGWQEVGAYLWELEHARDTGQSRRANWGIDPAGIADTTIGLARVLDGLFRNLDRMSGDLDANPSRIPAAELQSLSARVACALLATPWLVVHRVNPDIRRQDLTTACGRPVSTPGPVLQRAPDPGVATREIAPESSADEREAESISARVVAGESVAGRIREAPAGRVYRRLELGPTDDEADRLQAGLAQLTGREVSLTGDNIALGETTEGQRGSPTVTRFIQRAIASPQRYYRLRSGTSNPDGTPVRGSSWRAEPGRVALTVNPADIGEFTWTVEELLSDVFVAAVAAAEEGTATGGAPDSDRLLSTPLPYPSPEMAAQAGRYVEDLRLPGEQLATLGTILQEARGVTLAEILRGMEMGAFYRFQQAVTAGRVTATYMDPRSVAAVGAPQVLPRRWVTFLTGEVPATPAPIETVASEVDPVAAEVGRCSEEMLEEIQAHIDTARGDLNRTVQRIASEARMGAALRRHFGPEGSPENRPTILANLRLIASELDFSRHAWLCVPSGSRVASGCCLNPRVGGCTTRGAFLIQLCVNVEPPPFFSDWNSLLHEIVHSAGIGTLGRGEERYLRIHPDYPGTDPLHNADSYAELVRQVGAEGWQQEPQEPVELDLPGSLQALAGVGVGAAGAQPVFGAQLEVTPLGRGVRVFDWTAGTTFLWMPRYGVIPEGGGEAEDVAARFYVGGETGMRVRPSRVSAAVFDVSAGVGALWPGGGERAQVALTGRVAARWRFGSPSLGGLAGVDLRAVYDLVEQTQSGFVLAHICHLVAI